MSSRAWELISFGSWFVFYGIFFKSRVDGQKVTPLLIIQPAALVVAILASVISLDLAVAETGLAFQLFGMMIFCGAIWCILAIIPEDAGLPNLRVIKGHFGLLFLVLMFTWTTVGWLPAMFEIIPEVLTTRGAERTRALEDLGFCSFYPLLVTLVLVMRKLFKLAACSQPA